MEQEHIPEFTRLQNEAFVRLRAGVCRKGYLAQFRAIVLASVEDGCAYEILLRQNLRTIPDSSELGSRILPAICSRTIWRRSVDVEKFRDPVIRLKHGLLPLEPTIQEVQADISLEMIRKLLSKAHTATIPAYIMHQGLGVDGTGYELILGGLFIGARFNWWCDAPAGWEPLSALFGEIRALVDEAIVAGS